MLDFSKLSPMQIAATILLMLLVALIAIAALMHGVRVAVDLFGAQETGGFIRDLAESFGLVKPEAAP